MAPPRAMPNATGKKVRAIGSCGMTQSAIESEVGENDELDRSRDVRHVKGDEPRQPQAREPSCDARKALGIERPWQERCRLGGRIDLRAGKVPDVGDRLKKFARELVDFLQVTAIEEERGPVERRKRSHPLVFEV